MFQKLVITLLSGALCLLVVTPTLAVKYNESPMLKVMVAAGELPPVEERLPEEPGRCLDILPENIDLEIGRYGGTIRLLSIDEGTYGHDTGWVQREFLVRAPGFYCWPSNIVGDVFKDFKLSEDNKVFTFYLRKGMKWSDGHPFTTKDVRFWYEDCLLNEKVTPVIDIRYRAGGKADGELMDLKIIDEYTFQISFDKPYGCFPVFWGTNAGMVLRPAHYAKQFHARYTPMGELEPLIKETGFEKGEWWRLFEKMTVIRPSFWAEGRPTLYPYVKTEWTFNKMVFERNPYYWKVDAAGNQLPYIDKMETIVTSGIETGTMKILAGEIDLARRPVNTANLPLYKEYEDKAGFEARLLRYHAAEADVFLNLTNEDPVWRQVVRDLRFKKALSLAINREEIIDALYLGLAGLPRTIALNEYSPEKANQLLDEMGLDKRDKNGWRLGPDGKIFTVSFNVTELTGQEVSTAEIVRRFWEDVGIHSTLRQHELAHYLALSETNQLKAFIWWTHPPRWPFDEPGHLGKAWQTTYAPLWYQWYNTDGKEGEKPPAVYLKYRKLYERMLATLDGEVHEENWNEMRRILTEQVWIIPIVEDAFLPLIISKRLGNVAKGGIQIQASIAVEQMFFKE